MVTSCRRSGQCARPISASLEAVLEVLAHLRGQLWHGQHWTGHGFEVHHQACLMADQASLSMSRGRAKAAAAHLVIQGCHDEVDECNLSRWHAGGVRVHLHAGHQRLMTHSRLHFAASYLGRDGQPLSLLAAALRKELCHHLIAPPAEQHTMYRSYLRPVTG